MSIITLSNHFRIYSVHIASILEVWVSRHVGRRKHGWFLIQFLSARLQSHETCQQPRNDMLGVGDNLPMLVARTLRLTFGLCSNSAHSSGPSPSNMQSLTVVIFDILIVCSRLRLYFSTAAVGSPMAGGSQCPSHGVESHDLGIRQNQRNANVDNV